MSSEAAKADVEAILKRMEEGRIAGEKLAREALGAICEQLAKLNIQLAKIHYDGYGDSGSVERVTATAGEVEIELPEPLSEKLAEAADCLLPFGWEINDGSFGELVIDVAARKVTREHNWRVEETEYEEEEFLL